MSHTLALLHKPPRGGGATGGDANSGSSADSPTPPPQDVPLSSNTSESSIYTLVGSWHFRGTNDEGLPVNGYANFYDNQQVSIGWGPGPPATGRYYYNPEAKILTITQPKSENIVGGTCMIYMDIKSPDSFIETNYTFVFRVYPAVTDRHISLLVERSL